MSGTRVQASGATPWAKEDIVTTEHLIQHKEISKTHTLKVMDLETLRHNSIDVGLRPLYVIDTPKRRWIMMESDEFHELQETKAKYEALCK